MDKKKISLVIPMYCEESVIEECYIRVKENLNKISEYDYEIIFIDDGSTDKTMELLENCANNDSNVKIISFSRNFGHQAAVTAGLRHVSGDVIIIMDADLQDPPELISDMINLWEQGNDVVYGKRKSRDGESFFKLFTAKMFYKALNALSDVEIPKEEQLSDAEVKAYTCEKGISQLASNELSTLKSFNNIDGLLKNKVEKRKTEKSKRKKRKNKKDDGKKPTEVNK